MIFANSTSECSDKEGSTSKVKFCLNSYTGRFIGCSIFGEGSKILVYQKQKSIVFSLLVEMWGPCLLQKYRLPYFFIRNLYSHFSHI